MPHMTQLHSRHYLDISTTDLLFGARGFGNRQDGERELVSLEAELGPKALITFSVRSAWDLLLYTLNLPPGSEVIMSAVTIPDMPRIAEAHGLVVIPVDVDPETMMPRLDLYQNAFRPQTRLVLLAHLMGGAFDPRPYAEVAARRGVPLVEDCAQAYRGPDWWGSDSTLASFFSFGSIKTSTSLGAGVAVVRNSGVLERMRQVHLTRPIQDCRRFAGKAARYLAVQGFRSPVVYGAVASVASHAKGGLDGFISRTVKGFPAGSSDELLRKLRQRPSPAQVALLRRRLEAFDPGRLEARASRGEFLRERLASAGMVLGRNQPRRTHWLFAIAVGRPQRLIRRLREAGFDATQGATTIGPIVAPCEYPEFEPSEIREAMSRAVFLPAYPEMSESETNRMIDCINLCRG